MQPFCQDGKSRKKRSIYLSKDKFLKIFIYCGLIKIVQQIREAPDTDFAGYPYNKYCRTLHLNLGTISC
jgi:hypothetical protein